MKGPSQLPSSLNSLSGNPVVSSFDSDEVKTKAPPLAPSSSELIQNEDKKRTQNFLFANVDAALKKVDDLATKTDLKSCEIDELRSSLKIALNNLIANVSKNPEATEKRNGRTPVEVLMDYYHNNVSPLYYIPNKSKTPQNKILLDLGKEIYRTIIPMDRQMPTLSVAELHSKKQHQIIFDISYSEATKKAYEAQANGTLSFFATKPFKMLQQDIAERYSKTDKLNEANIKEVTKATEDRDFPF